MKVTILHLITVFFNDHLAHEKGCSPNTVASYGDCMRLFLTFLAERRQVHADDIDFAAVSDEDVLAFLDHLEQKRTCTAATRNQRLAALKTFYHFLAARVPPMMAVCQRITQIKAKRTSHRPVTGLLPEHMQALVNAPDPQRAAGARDQLLFLLFHNTGARVQELVDLTFDDLRLENPCHVLLTGKGRKQRIVPLWSATVEAILHYRSLRQPHHDSKRLFLNAHGQPITRFGVRHVVIKHAAALAKTSSAFAGLHATPHIFRHTTALHLVQAGVDIVAVKEILGHADIKTTSLYVQIDLNMKRKALDQCPAPTPNSTAATPQWQQPRVLEWLKALSKPGAPHYVKLPCPFPDVSPLAPPGNFT